MLNQKTAKATAILAILIDMGHEEHICIEPYLNGREQGYGVNIRAGFNAKKAVFAENRNSDNIVLYLGDHYDFSMQGNTPSEKVYENKKYFDCYDYVGAAKAICEYLELECYA